VGLAPRQERQERPILDGGQMHALWAVTRDADPLHPLWVLALTSGARVGELLALTWADVRLDAGEVEIRPTLERLPGQGWRLTEPKTDRSRRTLPLLPVAVDAPRWHRTRQEADRPVAGAGYGDYDSGGFVFAGPTDSPLRGDTVNKRWPRALRRARLPPLRQYDARALGRHVLAGGCRRAAPGRVRPVGSLDGEAAGGSVLARPARASAAVGGGGEAGETRTEHGQPEQGCDVSDGPGFG
jgi:integrase